MWNKVYGVVEKVVDPVADTIDNVHTSKEEKMKAKKEIEKVKNQLTSEMIDLNKKEMEMKRDVLVQDAKSDSFLLENWRPITILTLVTIYALILLNNYIIGPAIAQYTDIAELQFEMPPQLGETIKIIISTFTFGKSAEIVAGRASNSHDSNTKDTLK